jgi:hypothetical protein
MNSSGRHQTKRSDVSRWDVALLIWNRGKSFVSPIEEINNHTAPEAEIPEHSELLVEKNQNYLGHDGLSSVRSEKMYPIVKQANKVLHDMINIDLSYVIVYYIAQIVNTRREKTMHKIHDTHLSVSCIFFIC